VVGGLAGGLNRVDDAAVAGARQSGAASEIGQGVRRGTGPAPRPSGPIGGNGRSRIGVGHQPDGTVPPPNNRRGWSPPAEKPTRARPPEGTTPVPPTPANPNAPRPVVKSPKGADPKVTQELPPGQGRTPEENEKARQFFENHRDKARKWWEERTGKKWPTDSTHDHHPRELVNGGDPLLIEPGYGPSHSDHCREFFQEQGRIGGIRSGEVRRKK
jgi:hypothetical protein